MAKHALPERLVFVPLGNILSLGHYVRQLPFLQELLVVIVLIATAMGASGLLPLIPWAGRLANAAALYLVILVPTLLARHLCRKRQSPSP